MQDLKHTKAPVDDISAKEAVLSTLALLGIATSIMFFAFLPALFQAVQA